jgi:hypothetical protein
VAALFDLRKGEKVVIFMIIVFAIMAVVHKSVLNLGQNTELMTSWVGSCEVTIYYFLEYEKMHLASAKVDGIDSIEDIKSVDERGFTINIENKKYRFTLPQAISVGDSKRSISPTLYSVVLAGQDLPKFID